MGWTGGQYSLWRAVLAFVVAGACVESIGTSDSGAGDLVRFAVLASTIPLALGWRDRGVAFHLIAILSVSAMSTIGEPASVWLGGPLFESQTALYRLTALLALHVCTPPAPFGSFDARLRTDPRGGWQRPAWLGDLLWGIPVAGSGLAVLSALLFSVLPDQLVATADSTTSWQAGVAVLVRHVPLLCLFGVGFGFRRWRPIVWLALMGGFLVVRIAYGFDRTDGQSLLWLLALAESGWLSGRSLRSIASAPRAGDATPTSAHLFYDGDCGFCHRSVRFILAEELATPAPLRLRFAPLGSETFRERMSHHPELDPASLPDSIVLELEDGTILTRSAAALEIASRLGGFWRLLALIGNRLPGRLLDAGYDAIARVRKRIFTAPKDACPILPPDLRARFDP